MSFQDSEPPPPPRWHLPTPDPSAAEMPGEAPTDQTAAPPWSPSSTGPQWPGRWKSSTGADTGSPGTGSPGTGSPGTGPSTTSSAAPSARTGTGTSSGTLGDARAVGTAWLGGDLLAPGPGWWPFGGRARTRRERRREVHDEARRRRAELWRTFEGDRDGSDRSGRTGHSAARQAWRPVEPGRNRVVIAGLVAGVAAVVAVGVWFSSDDATGPARSSPATRPLAGAAAPTSSPTAPTSSSPSSGVSSGGSAPGPSVGIAPQPPIPTGGVAPISPAPDQVTAPGSVRVAAVPPGPPTAAELGSPQGAVTAWLSRWCAFTYIAPLGAAEQRARSAMTADGWAQFDPRRDPGARRSWTQTVADRETGQCSAPTVQLSPEAPRSASNAIVLAAAQRVVTAPGAPAYVEPVSQTRIVLRQPDGRWLVDTPTTGG